ncbi:MAG: hypothetical protein JKY37_30985 [Nannocystaceae bacterium]|nr:hypothetical protein [Nannocystaceae bacterium]
MGEPFQHGPVRPVVERVGDEAGSSCRPGAWTPPATTSGRYLLFGLEEADVVELNERYVADEPLEETMARLQAPFDCSLYDDLCKQVGRDRAIELTAELVDMGLDEATLSAKASVRLDARQEGLLDQGFRSNAQLVAEEPEHGPEMPTKQHATCVTTARRPCVEQVRIAVAIAVHDHRAPS